MTHQVQRDAPQIDIPEGAHFYYEFWKDYREAQGRRQKVTVDRQDQVFVEFHSDLLRDIFKSAPAPGRLISNMGCGKGTHSVPMEHRGFRVVNVDFSVEALELTREYYRRQGLKPFLVRCNLLQLPFKEECFDAVMSFGVMEHFRDIDTPFREMCRTLKRGGIFHSEIVTRRPSLMSIEVFFAALLYTLYNLALLRFRRIRGLSRTAHFGEEFFENSYPLQRYEQAVTACGISRVHSYGVRPFLMLSLPSVLDRWYAELLRLGLPLFRRITLSGSRMSKRICPVWLVSGCKPKAL